MAQYRLNQKIVFSASEESRFRQLMNRWAASAEGYNRPTLGDELRIVEVWDSPLYRVLLKTQYDCRTLESASKPLGRRNYPAKPAVSRAEIKRWSMAPYPTLFTSSNTSTPIDGTAYASFCTSCSGAGKITCATCHGTGRVKREVTTKRRCDHCSGYGYVYQKQLVEVQKQVQDYSDGGKLKLRYVKEEQSVKVTCPVCQGSRELKRVSYVDEGCKACGASGRLTCPTCKGEGQMVNYTVLARHLYTKVLFRRLYPSQIPQEELSKMSDFLGDSAPWKVVERLQIEGEKFKEAGLESRPVVGHIMAKLPSWVEHPDHTAVCFHRVETCECAAKTVIYEVDGSRYYCLLLGDEWRLVTATSPMTKRLNNLKEQVNALCRVHRYGEAWALLNEVNKFPQAGSAEAQMKEQLEERMEMVTRLGANIGLVLAGFLFAPLMYLIYTHFDFYAPWSRWLMNWLEIRTELMMGISYLFILFASMKFYRFELPPSSILVASPRVRFMKGLGYGFGWFFFFALLAVLMSFFGVMPLLTWAVKIVLAILFFVVAIVWMIISGIFSFIF